MYGASVLQLLRNNPYLTGRKYIYPGEILTVSYNTSKKIKMNGYVYPFISRKTLIETLPSLTYLSVFNYRVNVEGEVHPFYDDNDIIQLSKAYGAIPLMLTSTLSEQGEFSSETAYQILLSDEAQDRYIDNMISITQAKGYHGVNITFSFLNTATKRFYESFLRKISNRLKQEGLLVFVTISPASRVYNGTLFEYIDYSELDKMADNISFIHYIWGTNYGPPLPVYNNSFLREFLDKTVTTTPSDKLVVGMPVIGYDWELPYTGGKSSARSINLNAEQDLANETGSIVQFDETSQTPFFQYDQFNLATLTQHIVWFVDARSISSLTNLTSRYGLAGIGVWTIMVYCPQLWLIVNSQYEVEKLIV